MRVRVRVRVSIPVSVYRSASSEKRITMGADWPLPVASSSLIAETYSRLACLWLGLGSQAQAQA